MEGSSKFPAVHQAQQGQLGSRSQAKKTLFDPWKQVLSIQSAWKAEISKEPFWDGPRGANCHGALHADWWQHEAGEASIHC